MSKILKSAIFVALVGVVMAGTTGAYFTSTVTAADNDITVGSLLLAVDFGENDAYGGVWNTDAWNVVRENLDGTITAGTEFTAWDNAAPGDELDYFVGIRQRGTIPAQVRYQVTGDWVSGPRFGTTLPSGEVCPADAASADSTLVFVDEAELYRGCSGAIGCRNIRDGLANVGAWTRASGLTNGLVFTPGAGYLYGTADGANSTDNTAARYLIEEDEYVVYRIGAELSTATGACYQGASYELDFTVEGKQELDPAW